METVEKNAVNSVCNGITPSPTASELPATQSITISTNQNKSDEETLKTNMINHLAFENKAFFLSQQINDPDITEFERKIIAENLLQQSHKKFLFRFGAHIKEEHLNYFDNKTYSEEDNDEIQYLLTSIRKKLKSRSRDVRNRRYAALQKMIDSTSYFSEKEMMAREPLLYEQLIGRYMTDTEKRLRDGSALDDADADYSGVLMERISNDYVTDLKRKQELEEQQSIEYDSSDDSIGQVDDDASQENGIIDEKLFPQTPASFRQHWGEFESTDCGTSHSNVTAKRADPKPNYVTAEEKELLKDEFIGMMHSKFLTGKDAEFDYGEVDDNSDYDNIELESQDQQDRYFDEDDDLNDNYSNQINGNDEESEDELDAYMKNICNSVPME